MRRSKAGRIRDLAARRAGRLVTRELPVGRLFGDASVLFERLPPGSTLPTIHHRRTAELVICLKGSMTAVLDGKPVRVRAGDYILIPPGSPHQFRTGRAACEAMSLFSPALSIAAGADIVADADFLPARPR